MKNKDRAQTIAAVIFDVVCFCFVLYFCWPMAQRLWGEIVYSNIRDSYVVIDEEDYGNGEVEDEDKPFSIAPIIANGVTQEDMENNVNMGDYKVPNVKIDWDGLQSSVNSDIYAWIYIPDTNINYAVLQHPTELDYYLTQNVDRSSGYPGCIYSQYMNHKTFTDTNTVLYGHNMKNGTMFKDLHKYDNMEFLKEHQYCFIYTQNATYVYKLFAAHLFDDTHHILDVDYSTQRSFMNYVSTIVSSASDYVYDEEVSVTAMSRLLTLSTCDSGDTKRWLVQGVLIETIYK